MKNIVLYCFFFLLFLNGTEAGGQKSTLIVLPAGNCQAYTNDRQAQAIRSEQSSSYQYLENLYSEGAPDWFISSATPWYERIISRLFSMIFCDEYTQLLEELFGLPITGYPIMIE